MPNYSVTVAQYVCPASDISEHISTAGTEASGTSNMKFVMNGGLIIGTMDGANIEIREEGGADTMFIFGCLEDQIPEIKSKAKSGHYPIDPRMQEVFNEVRSGRFSCGDEEANKEFVGLIDTLCNIQAAGTWDGDKYLLIQDFASYIDAQNRVDATYAQKAKWCKLSIEAATSMAKFSTDRTMREYSDVIWGIKPSPRPMTMGGAGSPAPKAAATAGAPAAKSKA
jgi:starch phosphorylase